MAETITIPSPSVFLRSSPTPPNPPRPQPKHERKRSVTSKKKTTALGGNNVEAGAVTKPKQSKSRNGCVTCKTKRLKCDETKPCCGQCQRRNIECGGYKKDFKWRPFEENNPKANNIGRAKRVFPSSQDFPLAKDLPSKSSPVNLGRQIEDEKEAKRDNGPSPCSPPVDFRNGTAESSAFAQQVFSSPEQHSNNELPLADVGDRNSEPDNHVGLQSAVPDLQQQDEQHESPGLTHHAPDVPASSDPTTVALPALEAIDGFENLLPTAQSEYIAFDLHDTGMVLDDYLTGPSIDIAQQPIHDDDDMIEEMHMQPLSLTGGDDLALTQISTSSSSSSGFSEDALPGSMSLCADQAMLASDGVEMIIARFDHFTCGILSVKDGPNENPWRNLIWPMAFSSPALYHAILAMSAYHAARDVPQLKLQGHKYSDVSFRNLLEGMNQGTVKLHTAIATTLALAFAESWNQHTTSGNLHINGARAMINEALDRHKRAPLRGIRLARLKFLCNAWVYLDVIARLTSTDEDESDDYDRIFSLYSTPGSVHSGFGIDFGMPIDARLDPLMGCAGTLFPLIGRVANLVRRVRRSPSNSAPIITQAMELKLLVETWDPPEFIEPPEDPTSNVQHSLQTAEAYRWATLLYLHQAVPEIPSPPAAEMAKKTLIYLATVPLVSRFVIVHIFPMMAAGCEAFELEDREWVKERWHAMGQRLRIGPIDKCMEVTEEVWRRRDAHESRPTNRRALVSTAVLRGNGSSLAGQPRRGQSFSGVDSSCEGPFDSGSARPVSQRRKTMSGMGGASDPSTGSLAPEYTVRGRLHWLGVMQDWNWEVLLG